MPLIIRWLITALAIMVTAYLLPGVSVSGFGVALIVALVLGIINVLLKPILVILTLPITIVTLGLFVLVINAGLVLLTDQIVSGFDVVNFWWALLFSLVLSVISGIFHAMAEEGAHD